MIIKITKSEAGYVYIKGTDYRCSDCLLFLSETQHCLYHGPNDVIRPNGYCIYWGLQSGSAQDQFIGDPMGAYTKAESGYGELKNGTKCRRCVRFDPEGYCERVAGRIDRDGCCDLQRPKK